MGKRGKREIQPCSKTYGLPLYCASWVPVGKIGTATKEDIEETEDREGGESQISHGVGGDPIPTSPIGAEELVAVLGGGGGEGRSGVPNAILLARFDVPTLSLADYPIFRLGTEGEVPYRMVVHPGGDGILCSFPKGCRWFKWDFPKSKEAKLALRFDGEVLKQLEDVGLQLALAFSADGSVLASGGEDGHIRVFEWPSMEIILDQTDAHSTVKDLDFSLDAKFLASLGSTGPCRIWDLTSSTVTANLNREDGEVFGFCRYRGSSGSNEILYVTAMHGQHGTIISWNPLTWKRIERKRIVRDGISAFNVSSDGKFLAVGTVEGDVMILNSSNMRANTVTRNAHLGIVTALVFSQDSRALISASFDSTARVALIGEKKHNSLSMLLIIFVILLAILLYFIIYKEVL